MYDALITELSTLVAAAKHDHDAAPAKAPADVQMRRQG